MAPRDSELQGTEEALPQASGLSESAAASARFANEGSLSLTDRALHHAVWRLAWPSVMTMLLQTVNGLLDVFFVGHLPDSKQALAATGFGGQVMFLLISLAMGISVGVTALVARFIGAQETAPAAKATGQSLALSGLLGGAFFLLFYFGRDALIGWLLAGKNDPWTAALCSQFLGMALLATVPLFLLNALMGAFRGLGDTRTPLRIQFVTVGAHILFDVLLIYGLAGFPRLGVRGAGAALAISIIIGLIWYLAALQKKTPLTAALRREQLLLEKEWAGRILRIGLPAAVQAVARSLGMMAFTGLLAYAADGAAGVAALQIGLRAEALAFMPGFGYSVAASALVGQSLGARNPERAERYGWAATWQGMVIMSGMAMVFYLFADPITRLFTSDVTVQRLGADYLRISAFCEPFLALGMVLTGALQGAGDTLRPTYITILTMWILRMPLAWALMFAANLQTRGAWLAMAFSTCIGGLMTVGLFRSGKWKQARV